MKPEVLSVVLAKTAAECGRRASTEIASTETVIQAKAAVLADSSVSDQNAKAAEEAVLSALRAAGKHGQEAATNNGEAIAATAVLCVQENLQNWGSNAARGSFLSAEKSLLGRKECRKVAHAHASSLARRFESDAAERLLAENVIPPSTSVEMRKAPLQSRSVDIFSDLIIAATANLAAKALEAGKMYLAEAEARVWDQVSTGTATSADRQKFSAAYKNWADSHYVPVSEQHLKDSPRNFRDEAASFAEAYSRN